MLLALEGRYHQWYPLINDYMFEQPGQIQRNFVRRPVTSWYRRSVFLAGRPAADMIRDSDIAPLLLEPEV